MQQVASLAMNSFLLTLLNPFNENRINNTDLGPTVDDWLKPSAPTSALAFAPFLRPDDRRQDPRWNSWISAFTGLNRVAGNATIGSHTTDGRINGLAVGIDQIISHNTLIGFSLAGGTTSWNLTEGLGGGRTDMFEAGLYSLIRRGPAYLSAALAYAWHQTSTNRTLTIAGTDQLAADFMMHGPGLRIESGYRIATNFFEFTPYAAGQFQFLFIPAYQEHAALGAPSFALKYLARATPFTRSELGAWFVRNIPLADGVLLALRSRLAWAYDFNTSRRFTASLQGLPSTFFTIEGAASTPNLALGTAVVELRFRNHLSVGGRFETEFAKNLWSYSGKGIIRFEW